MVLAAAQIATG